jgi:repressor LexA
MKELTDKQTEVLKIINDKITDEGLPPTLDELRTELKMTSKNGVLRHLEALVKKGYIQRSSKARDIKILKSSHQLLGKLMGDHELQLPLIGTVAAGLPILAEANIERYLSVPRYLVPQQRNCFMLRVRGDSMENAGIIDGDFVVVEQTSEASDRDIVVAMVNGEVTLKRLLSHGGNRWYLKAENPRYANIMLDENSSIQGRVWALIREKVQ